MLAMFPLRLTDEDASPLKVSPETLLSHLLSSIGNLKSILQDLNCSPQDLQKTLSDPQTTDLLKLKAHLATLQLKLLAIDYLPHAFAKLVSLMQHSDKPEVARRAATTVLNIGGIQTHTTPNSPEPPPAPPEPAKEQVPELNGTETAELLEAVAQVLTFKRKGIDLSTIPDSRVPELFQTLLAFVTPTAPSD
jgi:hypothetical protein